VSKYLLNRIREGEHQEQDFKFEISDSRKIARSLVAFSNTDGGRLLVGVKDNGKVAGVRSDEEFYMVEAAAQLYSRPQVQFQQKEWNLDGKTVLEITVPKDPSQIYRAQDKDKQWYPYLRVRDQNIRANSVWVAVRERLVGGQATSIRFELAHKLLLNHLDTHRGVELDEFARLARLPRDTAHDILVDLVCTGILRMEFTEKEISYRLQDQGFMSGHPELRL